MMCSRKRIPEWMQAQDSVFLLDDSLKVFTLIAARPAGDGRWWKLVMTHSSQRRMNREKVDALHSTTLELMTADQLAIFKALAGLQ